jgi:hypothetical protein
MNFSFHQSAGVPLKSIINTASDDAIKLMVDFLAWCPEKRPSAINVCKLSNQKKKNIKIYLIILINLFF